MTRDEINMTSADALFGAFTERANAEHARRLANIQRRLTSCMADEPTGEALKAIIGMDLMHRYLLFERVMWSTDGARSIDGMEAVLSFVANYLLDDSYCHAVAAVPSKESQATFRGGLVGPNEEWTEDDERIFAEWLAYKARWLVLVPGEDEHGCRLGASELVEVIRHNEALHVADEEMREREMDDL